MFIDTHAHLNFKAFDSLVKSTVDAAKEAGVKKIINVGSNFETSQRAVQIAKKYYNCFAAVGLHPIHVKDEVLDEGKFLELANSKKVVAIGETGLDYYYDRSTSELQKEIFAKHIKLSNISGKPLILHTREAYDDILSVLMANRPIQKAVMHCFQGDWNFAQIILDMGFLLSFTGIITFTKDQKTFEVIEKTPLDRIMIETDCPYLTPEPYRGRQNEPAYVVEVARKIAEIKKITLEEVETQTTQNAQDFFKLV